MKTNVTDLKLCISQALSAGENIAKDVLNTEPRPTLLRELLVISVKISAWNLALNLKFARVPKE